MKIPYLTKNILSDGVKYANQCLMDIMQCKMGKSEVQGRSCYDDDERKQ